MSKPLMGVRELADELGVTKQRAHQVVALPDFPEPYVELAMGPIWHTSDVEAWLEAHDVSSKARHYHLKVEGEPTRAYKTIEAAIAAKAELPPRKRAKAQVVPREPAAA